MSEVLFDGKQDVLVLAKTEGNEKQWNEGRLFEYSSKIDRLQRLAGNGGTVWVFRSAKFEKRRYSLFMRLRNCESVTGYDRFGEFALQGDSRISQVFAHNDAKLLLYSLRFIAADTESGPLRNDRPPGEGLQMARLLSEGDVGLLTEFSEPLSDWEVFVSYSRSDESIAGNLRLMLLSKGIKTFRDHDNLIGGEEWWPSLKEPIATCKTFLLIVGPDSHAKKWVREEVAIALQHKRKILPLLLDGGNLEGFDDISHESIRVSDFHAIRLDLDNPEALLMALKS